MRSSDIAGCGHSSTNIDEVRDELSAPDCDWAHGSVTVWRGAELVGALITFDGLASGRGWMIDAYTKPNDPRVHGIQGALIDGALREGRTRFDLLFPDPDEPMQMAKAGCYTNEGALRADLEQRGFVEVRTYWRMKVDHVSVSDALNAEPLAVASATGDDPRVTGLPDGYMLRTFRDGESDWRGVHEAHSASFLDHFDFTPLGFEAWREHTQGVTEDPSQWLVAEHNQEIVGYARGSNRYASEECGYVASIGVVREHRGHGVARALLRARMADDVARGFLSTILHVDASSPTGATRLYESVGMVADSEFVGLHRPLYG